MDRSKWEEILVRFQARARGYLVRQEVRRACGDFEDIVREIDGSLVHLKWRDAAVSIPHFTDTDGPLLTPNTPGPEVSASPRHPSTAERGETRVGHCLLSERTEAERDDSHVRGRASLYWGDCIPCSPVRVDGETQREIDVPGDQMEDKDNDGDGGVIESTGESTSVWSSFGPNMNYDHSFKGPPPSCLAQDVPRTPVALRCHRNTLTMELIWLQQAIDSRKKYLSLKDRLSVS